MLQHRSGRKKQRGAALMVMLVIVIVGAVTLLVNSLSNSATVRIARDKTTADALAQAKAALIGRAVADVSSPGSLPCPDTDNDGSAELLSGNDCPSYIGRLPWRTLGLTDLRDGSGERLWYALSLNFRDDNSNPINSDTSGNLTIGGTYTVNNIIAIVFAAGSTLSTQTRSSTQTAGCTTTGTTVAENLCATNYLEGSNANLSTAGTPNTGYQAAASSLSFNDQMIYIAHDDLFAPVEIRIAREVKACLDQYASSSSGKYPWAASTADTAYYLGAYGTLFGRIPAQPNIDTSSGTGSTAAATLSAALAALQTAAANFFANPSSANKTSLIHAGNNLISIEGSLPDISSTIDAAGRNGKDYATGSQTYANVVSSISAANTAVAAYLVSSDSTMSPSWTSACTTLLNSSFWPAWRNLVFYQVSAGYKPGSSASCGSCISISGSGNTSSGTGTYRAAIVVARQKLTGQNRADPAAFPPNDYLSNAVLETDAITNAHTSETNPSTTFVTYKTTDALYQTVNDLVLCVDGYNSVTNPAANCR